MLSEKRTWVRFRLQLNNTVGIIDDYYNSDNEGHIFAKLTNDSNEEKQFRSKPEGRIFVNMGLPLAMLQLM